MTQHADHGAAALRGGRLIDPRRLRNSAGVTMGVTALSAVLAGVSLASMTGTGNGDPDATEAMRVLPDPSTTQVPNPPFPSSLTDEERRHLTTFDEMDFVVFSQAQWARFGESHAPNVRAHWPDGHYTDGLDQHVGDMQAIFEFAPDSHIYSHPLRIAKDNLTCVIGVMAGTFTKPMPDGKGGQIAPTNKPYSFNMATIGVWNKNGTMDEEWLYWDDQNRKAQLGIS